jgi:hypothetical protein
MCRQMVFFKQCRVFYAQNKKPELENQAPVLRLPKVLHRHESFVDTMPSNVFTMQTATICMVT